VEPTTLCTQTVSQLCDMFPCVYVRSPQSMDVLTLSDNKGRYRECFVFFGRVWRSRDDICGCIDVVFGDCGLGMAVSQVKVTNFGFRELRG